MISLAKFSAVLAVAAFFSGPLGQARAQDALVAAAEREGKVTWYAPVGSRETLKSALEDWNRRYPKIAVEIVEASGPDTIERLRTERRANRRVADVATFGDQTAWEVAKEDGYEPLDERLPNLGAIHPRLAEFMSSKRLFVPTVLYVYGINVNTKALPESDWPRRWRDLTDPKYRGKIATQDFMRPGGGLLLLMIGLEPLGKEFFAELMKQDVRSFGRVPELESSLVRGERPIAAPGRVRMVRDFPDAPVKWIAPEDGVIFAALATGAIKNAPHPNAAQLWVNFLLGRAAQEAYAKVGDVPVVKGVSSPFDLDSARLLGKGGGTENDLPKFVEAAKYARQLVGK